MGKTKDKWQFGDFQTPIELSNSATNLLKKLGYKPRAIIEPTCGKGSFLFSAIQAFPSFKKAFGLDINQEYVEIALSEKIKMNDPSRISIVQSDFFSYPWENSLSDLPQPILFIGNPPWVTNSELGLLNSSNLPAKSNFQKLNGFDAITGKSNFDISEWMLLKYFEWLDSRSGFIAVLCKTAVARKVLLNAWRSNYPLSSAKMFQIDTKRFFNASVDACFLVVDKTNSIIGKKECQVYPTLDIEQKQHTFGYHDGLLLADVNLYESHKDLRGSDSSYIWRSGVKHDCSKVMELEKANGHFVNGLGESVNLEDIYVFPMLKSSDVANGSIRYGRKHMIVTQSFIGEDTSHIQFDAPNTWEYLSLHAEHFNKRASSIYRNRPPYSIFGVGDYSFAPYKIAISGFYKSLTFKLIEMVEGKPVVLDDTVNFLPCWSIEEADFLLNILNSQRAQEFLASMIFWEEKRPITVDILKRLNIKQLASLEKQGKSYSGFSNHRFLQASHETTGQFFLVLEEERHKYICSA
jgi:hypothetical protein